MQSDDTGLRVRSKYRMTNRWELKTQTQIIDFFKNI